MFNILFLILIFLLYKYILFENPIQKPKKSNNNLINNNIEKSVNSKLNTFIRIKI